MPFFRHIVFGLSFVFMEKSFLSFQPESTGLPIVSCIPEIKEALTNQNTLIVQAAPGAGKSTVLPLALLNESWLNGKKILMLEPRRLAAKSIASRMADLLNEPIGETVGFRVRLENKVSSRTRIEVLTEGILTRKLEHDNNLEDVGLVIFDEFHERSIHADLALALCRLIQEYLRPDLRILIMSATLNSFELSGMLQAPVIQSEGRQYPVDIQYMVPVSELFMDESTVAEVVEYAVKRHEGDVLVFLPGEAEIRKCAEKIEKLLPHFAIHPLYGRLNPKEQQRAIMPDPNGNRKVVLATSIAETSLTIEGVQIVVDSGKMRVSRFDPELGLSRLETVSISKDAADQRAGRAGRLAPGVCYRMWSRETQARLSNERIPEILEADLCPFYLSLAVWGFSKISDLRWIDPPPDKNMDYAREVLNGLRALDENGRITPHGRAIHGLACHPRLAHMLLKANGIGAGALAADIAALLEEKDPMPRDTGPDINLRIEALRRVRNSGKFTGLWAQIEKTAESYRKMLQVPADSAWVDPYLTGKLLALAYPERVANFRPTADRKFQMANGQYARLDSRHDLAREDWVAVAHLSFLHVGRYIREPDIVLGSPLNFEDIAFMATEKDVLTWDTRKGGLYHAREKAVGSIFVDSRSLPLPDAETCIPILLDALKKEGKSLLNWNEETEQLQNRVLSLANWSGDRSWPDLRTEKLLDSARKWITLYLMEAKKPEDLKKLPLAEILFRHLPYEKQAELNELAPAKIKVPSGSVLPLKYSPDGSAPVLEVRLQEVFGMEETPRIFRGQVGIVMHLLSPGYKPVQITSNLKSFWNNTYYEVRNELRRRYPKHAWPDDPWSAQAVAKGRPTKK